jgi:hypothetical protein
MNRLLKIALWHAFASGAALAAVAPLLAAEPTASTVDVASVARPAVYLRGRETTQLLPQVRLATGDEVRTGQGGRVNLRFAGDAGLLVGDDSSVRLVDLGGALRKPAEPVRLRVQQGVVVLSSPLTTSRADLAITVGQLEARLTSGVIWAETRGTRDTICLQSGFVDIAYGERRERLSDPGRCIAAAPGLALAFPRITSEQERAWADATHAPRQQARSGDWMLVLATLEDKASAEAEAGGLRGEQLPASVRPYSKGGRILYRVVMGPFESRDAATQFCQQVCDQHGILGAWPIKDLK